MNYFFAGTLCPATAFALTAGTDWTEVLWLLSALVGQVGQVEEIGTTGPLILVGSGFSYCPRDGLADPVCMFYHTTVRLQRNKFYLTVILPNGPWIFANFARSR